MEFSPFNPVVKCCLQGMAMEEQKRPQEAVQLFLQAWDEASNDFEKFLAAHYLARHQDTNSGKLQWLETALQHAILANNDAVNSALPALYANIAQCYEEVGDLQQATANRRLSNTYQQHPSDKGPFYHGTKADLQPGDLLVAGGGSNYKSDLTMNHIYFTALVNGAGLAAALAKGDGPERVYIVEPSGAFENDPNLTDKKFPGNPSRSYRSASPLQIIGAVMEWVRPNPEDVLRFRQKLAENDGEIIN